MDPIGEVFHEIFIGKRKTMVVNSKAQSLENDSQI